MTEEKHFDALKNPIEEGIYAGVDGSGLFRVKKGEHGEFMVIDSFVPNKEYAMVQSLAFKLTPVSDPEYKVKSLRKQANWLENQLEQLAQSQKS